MIGLHREPNVGRRGNQNQIMKEFKREVANQAYQIEGFAAGRRPLLQHNCRPGGALRIIEGNLRELQDISAVQRDSYSGF